MNKKRFLQTVSRHCQAERQWDKHYQLLDIDGWFNTKCNDTAMLGEKFVYSMITFLLLEIKRKIYISERNGTMLNCNHMVLLWLRPGQGECSLPGCQNRFLSGA